MGAVVVLNLHRVAPEYNPFWQPMVPSDFDHLLTFVKRHFQPTTFAELSEPYSGQRPRIILSFDDGYYDFVEYVMPLLDNHRIRVNQNVIGSCVNTGEPPTTVALFDFLNQAPPSLINEIKLPGFEASSVDRRPETKSQFGIKLSAFIKNRPRIEREALLQQLAPILAKAAQKKTTRMMTVGDIVSVAATHEIGSHSHSHDSMQFETDEYFAQDLARSQTFFQSELGLPLKIYAFPNGGHRPELLNVLANAGIEHILLVEERLAHGRGRVHPRLTMRAESPAEARFEALGFKAKGTQ